MQRKILILGGTNYFGKHLVQLLLNNGDDITIVTRGNNPILKNYHAIIFGRNNPNEKLVSRHYWGVVYDQSCYASYSLKSLESVIKNCGCYILTSSQAMYLPLA